MRMSVCVRVCLSVCPRWYLRNHTRDLYQIFVHVAYDRGSVLLRHGDEIPRGRGKRGLLPHWQYIVQHRIWNTYENGWTDRHAVWDDEWVWPEEQCVYVGVTIPEGEGAFLGGNMCVTSVTPLWIVNWTGPCSGVHKRGANAWLQALDESIIGREGDCTPRAKSDIYDCLVFNVLHVQL